MSHLSLSGIIAALGRYDFAQRGDALIAFNDDPDTLVNPTELPEWNQSAYDTAADAPTPRALPRWAVEGVISDLPGRNPGEDTLLDTFRNGIEAIEDDITRRIFKGKLAVVDQWHRDSLIVEQVRQLLGMTVDEIDAFWAQGEALVAAAERMGV